MSISSLEVIMDRIKSATKESQIAVFQCEGSGLAELTRAIEDAEQSCDAYGRRVE